MSAKINPVCMVDLVVIRKDLMNAIVNLVGLDLTVKEVNRYQI